MDANSRPTEGVFRAALDESPRNSRLHFNFGTFLLGRGRYVDAITQLSKAVHADGSNADAWANLGVALAKTGDLDHARRAFEHALRLDANHEIARQNLAAIGRRP